MLGQNVMVEVKNTWNSGGRLAERKTNQKRHKWAIEDFGTIAVLLTVCTMTNIDVINILQLKFTCILMFYRFYSKKTNRHATLHSIWRSAGITFGLCHLVSNLWQFSLQKISYEIVEWYNNSIFLQLSGFIHCISIDLILRVRNCDVLYAHVKKTWSTSLRSESVSVCWRTLHNERFVL